MSSIASSADSIADQLTSMNQPAGAESIASEGMHSTASATHAYQPQARRGGRTASKAKPKASKSSYGVFMPVLLVMGVALLIPGLWGVGILAGMDVPMADRHNARVMAMLMMVCWPLSLFLITVGGVMALKMLRKSA